MAVFLNRNKRPQAAPIEVAELLSEKPPLPPESPVTLPPSFRKGARGRGLFYRKDLSLAITHSSLPTAFAITRMSAMTWANMSGVMDC